MEKEAHKKKLVAWFSELSNKDVAIAGGKGASLAEMYNHKFPVPPGFVVTADAYKYFIEKSGLGGNIITMLKETNVDDTNALEKASKKIKGLIVNANMPSDLMEEIIEAYDVLDIDKKNFSAASRSALDILKNSHEPPFVAVRSSATTEDLADASFAGQQETFLNVKGNDSLIESVKKAFASLFTARAIYYRVKKGFIHGQSYLAVVVQKMIDADKSGVIFSKNPLKNDGNIVLEAVWGLGEGIVSGMISPDHYVINQKFEIVERNISEKEIALTRSSSGRTEKIKLTPEISKREVLTGHEVKVLSQFALRLEEHYNKPQDIEFAISNEGIFIVQSRPITTKVVEEKGELDGNVLFSGLGASPGVSSGAVRIIYDLGELAKVQKGDVLVTKMTNPDMVVAMQRSAAIITDEGGITSHAAIVSREMGIPAVVGTKVATEKLHDGQIVTVDGYTGRIIEGKGVEKKVEIKKILHTNKIKIKTIVDLPDYAERAAESGVKGVGLVRLEGIIATSGKHPAWFVKKNKMDEYISLLHNGLKKILKPFDEIWVRSSDIRSDEYRNLEGAPQTEEMNPMLGDHGIRFSLKNIDILEAEFKAIKELADEHHNKKIGVMVPQVISVKELKETKKIAEAVGFPDNVKIGVMIETPAAVQIIEDLCEEGIDFVSFGTNDLTQYTLAIDRNNENVQDLYDEMNPAVLNSIAHVLKVCKKYGVETSICGQAGSKPEMAKFLVEHGIDSISVNADAAYEVSKVIIEGENKYEKIPMKLEHMEALIDVQDETIKDDRALIVDSNLKISPADISEEEIILRALDNGNENLKQENITDEYSPGVEKEDDVPKLNEAIPVDSDYFSDDEIGEIIAVNKDYYENQQENKFGEEVEKEIEESSVRESLGLGAGQNADAKKKEASGDEVLDIF